MDKQPTLDEILEHPQAPCEGRECNFERSALLSILEGEQEETKKYKDMFHECRLLRIGTKKELEQAHEALKKIIRQEHVVHADEKAFALALIQIAKDAIKVYEDE